MLFLFRKLYNRYLLILDKIDKKRKVAALKRKHKITGDFQFCWNVNRVEAAAYSGPVDNGMYTIFGTPISLDRIDWHKDYVSGFVYPIEQFNKINITQWFDKGIDVKFPWEVSRFYFATSLGQRFILTGDEKYYRQFKQLVIDWIDKNPFLYGVNWYCAMEVGIRAVNWIVAANFFRGKIVRDHEFRKILTESLVQHGFYISTFPEIKKNGLSNNHLIADYTGLLFLSLSLSDSPETILWRKQAVDGLLHCMETQVNDDGTDFEGSIPYHRLVLEFFGYASLLCRIKDIELPEWFYVKLFKMFEFTAAYMDHGGNAPQIGDNDSGRAIKMHLSDEHDHSYLLHLGEHLFGYNFKSICNKHGSDYVCWLPRVDRLDILKAGIVPRKTERSILFPDGDCIFLKNENFMVSVSIIDRKKEFKTGHVHHDAGSIIVSYKGIPVIVDPGTYTYTRNLENRIQYVQYSAHNVPVIKNTGIQGVELPGFFDIRIENKLNLLDYTDTAVVYDHTYFLQKVQRNISIHRHSIKISDRADSSVISSFHLHPRCSLIDSRANSYYQFNVGPHVLTVRSDNVLHLYEYDYSDAYGIKESSIKLCAESFGDTDIELEFS